MATPNYALTTTDNPYDPFTDFDKWYLFDTTHGYNTCAYLARIAKVDDTMSYEEVRLETKRAIDEIMKYDFTNLYIRVEDKEDDDNQLA